MRAERENRPRGERWLVPVGVAVGVVACLGACLAAPLIAGGGWYAAATPAMPLYGTRLCAGVGEMPYFQVGVAWELPRQAMILSSLGPSVLYSPYAVCLHLPWEVPGLPMRGGLLLPP
jgi:hypothetical protein